MKERKYKEDWVNETRFDERGREKRVPVYKGAWYASDGADGGKTRRTRTAALSCLAYWALLLVYFLLNFPGATTLAVFLPAGLSLFPGLYWALGAFAVFRAPEKMTRLQKENGAGRVLRSSAACCAMMLLAALCDCVFVVFQGKASAEWPGLLILLCAACVSCFSLRYFRDSLHHITERSP